MNKLLKVKCPTCENIFYYYQSDYRPFCTERCKMVDLGHWFEESYRVPLKEDINPENINGNKNDESKDQDSNQTKSNESEIEDEYDKSEYE